MLNDSAFRSLRGDLKMNDVLVRQSYFGTMLLDESIVSFYQFAMGFPALTSLKNGTSDELA